eukprot:TRINITY_DN9167_c0_g1_i1.p1 TRINITY_DN9167_c0_g1~~TRINITY_DN9167_c0_g1_i1.p1  ORF type:complete len:1963 (-),score=493.43 TRINITY_DN9167_c0_g1_i1:59-5947(-)
MLRSLVGSEMCIRDSPWAAASTFLNTVLEAYMPLGDSPATVAVDPSSLSATMAGCEQVCTYVRALTDSGYAPVLYTHVVAKLRLHAAAAVARLGTQAKLTINNNYDASAQSLQETVQLLCAAAGKELCDIVDRNTVSDTVVVGKKQSSSSSTSPLEMFIASEVKRVNKELNVSSTTAATSEATIATQQQSNDAPSSAAEILVAASPEIALLRAAVKLWDRWASVLTIVSDVFMYLGRRYVLLETSEGSIMQLGVKLLEQELNSAHAKSTVFESANSAFACLLVADQTMATSLVMGGSGSAGTHPTTSASMETKSVALQIGAWCFANDQKRVLGYRTRGGIRSPNNGGFGTSAAPHFSTLRTLVSELLSYRDLTTSVNYYVSSLHPRVVSSLTQMYDTYSAWLVSEASPAEALLSIAGIPSRTFNHSNSNTNNVTHRSLASNNNSANSSSRVSPTTTGPNIPVVVGGGATVLEMLSQLMAPDALTPAVAITNNTSANNTSSSSSGPATTAATIVASSTSGSAAVAAPHTPATIVEAIRTRCSSTTTATTTDSMDSHTISAAVFFHCAHHLVYRERRRAVVFLNNSCSSVSGSSEMVEELVQQHAIKPFVGILFQRDFRDLVVEGIALETHQQGISSVSSSTSSRVPTGLDAVALGFHLLCMRYVRQKDVAKETFHSFIETISGWYMQAASLLGDEAGGGGSGLPSSNSSEAVAVQLSIMKDFATVLGTSLVVAGSLSTTTTTLLENIDVIESEYLSSQLKAANTPIFTTTSILKSVTLKKVAYLKSYTRLVRQQSLLQIAKDAVERQFPTATPTTAGATTTATAQKSEAVISQSRFASVIASIAFRRHLRTFVSVLPTSESAESAADDEPCTSEKLFASWLSRMGVASSSNNAVDFGGLVQGERGWGCGGGIHPSPLIELPTLIPEHLITNLVALRQACDSIVRRCFLGEAATSPPPHHQAESTPITDGTTTPSISTLADVVTGFSTAVFSETAKAAASRAAVKAGGKGGHHHHATNSHHTPHQQVTAGFYAAEFTRAIRVGFERGFNKFAPCDDDDSSDDEDDKDKASSGGENTSTLETAFGLVGPNTTLSKSSSSSASTSTSSTEVSQFATKLERFHTYLQCQRPLELRGEVVPELLAQHIDTLMRTLRTSVATHLVALSTATTTTTSATTTTTHLESSSQNQFMNSLIDVSGLEVRDRVQASLIKSSHGAVTCAKKDIDRALTLFDYLPSKDVFEALYVRDFSKRALGFVQECVLRMSENAAATITTTSTPSSPSTGVDVSSFVSLERHAIRQLRLVCGTSLTSKLEGMLKDLTDGFGKINDAYLEWNKNKQTSLTSEQQDDGDAAAAAVGTSSPSSATISPAGAAAGVFFVLSQSFWPFADTFKPNPSALPPAISKELEAFTTFFSTHRKSCALRWVPTLSECVVGFKANTTNAPLDLHMSLLQGLILTACFNSDIDNKKSSTNNNNNKNVSVDEIVRTVCEMEAPAAESTSSSTLALPIASSVGITVSSSGATLAKVESRRALARSKTLTREQQAVLANVQCALVSLAAPEVGILTPVFAQTPLGVNNTTLYPLLGGMIQGFTFNPSAAILDPISSPGASQQQIITSRNVPQLVVSNLGTSAYASAASSQPLSGSHAVVRQHMLARATSSALEKQQQSATTATTTPTELLSVEQICDLKWTACLKYLNAELLHNATHPATSRCLLPTSSSSTSALSPVKKSAGGAITSPPPSALHTQITMRLVSALGDFMDNVEEADQKDAESEEKTTKTTLFNEVSTFVPVFLSEADVEMASTMIELDAPNQRIRCALHTTTAAAGTTMNINSQASTFKMMITPAFIKVYPHLAKHVIASTTSGGIAGSNASPHRDSSSRVAKSVALQRPYIIDVAVVQVLKNVGKLSFNDLLAQVHNSPAVANKFEVAAPLLKNRLTQLKARGVIALSGGGDDGGDVATMIVEYKA